MLGWTVPQDLAAHEREAILAHFKALPDDARMKSRVFELRLPDRPPFLIKHGSGVLDEACTQQFFCCLPRNDAAPRIPRVFDAFRADGFCFLVMLKIDAPTLKDAGITDEEAVGHAAHAIKWLIDQTPFVPSSVFGHISPNNVPAWHKFFKEQRAPHAFDSDMLLKYVKRAFRRCPGAQLDQTLQAELETSFQERSICHSDIDAENFLLDAHKNVWLVDFQHVSVLPPVFQTYVFFNIDKKLKFASDVGKRLGYQASALSNAMVTASSMLQQCGGSATLGLKLGTSLVQ